MKSNSIKKKKKSRHKHLQAAIFENIASPGQKFLDPIQLFNDSFGIRDIIMIIRNRQIRPSIRQVKRRNQQVSPFFLHLPNNIPILFIRPHWFSPWFRRFPWRVSPQFPQILFSPVLSILRKIKEILVENIVSVFVFFHRLHPFALQYLREPRNVFSGMFSDSGISSPGLV